MALTLDQAMLTVFVAVVVAILVARNATPRRRRIREGDSGFGVLSELNALGVQPSYSWRGLYTEGAAPITKFVY